MAALPDAVVSLSRENSMMRRAIVEAIHRRIDPTRGDPWEPLYAALGISPEAIKAPTVPCNCFSRRQPHVPRYEPVEGLTVTEAEMEALVVGIKETSAPIRAP
jgi:hypothetical protein